MTALAAENFATESTVQDYITLLKPGVMSLVVFTGAVGMWLAPGHLNILQQLLAIFCIALGSGAGAAINMWYDRDIDAIMHRTNKRPIPQGRIAPDDALAFGIMLSLLSVMLMGLSLNWVAAILLGIAIAFYVFIYTMWLKRSTPQNIVIGGAAGAFPPMIGWAAVTGDVSLFPVILFSIIFLWTPPHFWALALFRNDDYRRANIPMLPNVAGADATKKQMLIYTVLLIAVTLLPIFCKLAGIFYTGVAAICGAIFLHHVIRTMRSEGDHWPKKTFVFSILYLFVLFTALVVDNTLTTIFHS